jgi:hypothetical protein
MAAISGLIICGETSGDLSARTVGAAQDSARQPIGLGAPAPGHPAAPRSRRVGAA